jgi:hypothetical protein
LTINVSTLVCVKVPLVAVMVTEYVPGIEPVVYGTFKVIELLDPL